MINIKHLFTQSIGVIPFDTIVTEQHESGLTVTQYPVESGAPISDHTYKKPDRLTLVIAHGMVDMKSTTERNISFERLTELWYKLEQTQTDGTTFDVNTGIKLYSDMVIETMQTLRDNNTATILRIELIMRQVISVDVEGIKHFNIRYSSVGGVRRRAAAKVTRGTTAPTDVSSTPEAEPVRKSALVKLFGSPVDKVKSQTVINREQLGTGP